jgi:ectoine hydroxylase-related dioxygenase (phytanoyl-CoA dioxygenase family)
MSWVPLPAGSALFFDGFLHHGTPANRTRTGRRAVQFHYARGDVVETESAEHERIYGSTVRNVVKLRGTGVRHRRRCLLSPNCVQVPMVEGV